MLRRFAITFAAPLMLTASALGGLSEATPTRETIAFWRVHTPLPKTLAPWIRQQIDQTITTAIRQFDEDPAALAIAHINAWAACNGYPSTGVALTSTPEQRAAREKVVLDAVEAFQKAREEAEKKSPAPASPASPPKPGETIPNSSVSAPKPESNKPAEAKPAEPKPAEPGAAGVPAAAPAVSEPPKSPIPPREPRSMAVEIILGLEGAPSPASVLRDGAGLEGPAADAATRDILGRSVFSVQPQGWVRPLLYTLSAGRLVLATDERAMQFALSEQVPDGDVLREDWLTHKKVVNDSHTNVKPGAVLLVNANAIRHELGIEWEASLAYRMFNSWRMPNLRSISLHVGLAPSTGEPKLPPLLVVDAAWSAKSDAPGQAMRETITMPAGPRAQSAMLIPGADVLVIARPRYGYVVDWVFRTYLADVAGNMQAAQEQYTGWRVWLGDHRAIVNQTTDALGVWTYLGLTGVSDPKSPPVIHWRTGMKSGFAPDRIATNLAALTKDVGACENTEPAPSVWSAPVNCAWLKGAASWTMSKVFGANVLIGAVTVGESNGPAIVRDVASRADVKPPPLVPPPEPKRPKP